MKSDIQKKAAELFKQLAPDEKKATNEWVIREKKVLSLPIFLASPTTPDADGKEFCIMLKKAIDAKDFSAFTGKAPKPEAKDEPEAKPEPKAEGKTILDVAVDMGKAEVIHIGDKPEPEAKPATASAEPPKAPAHPADGDLHNALVDFVKRHAPAATGSPAPVAPAKSEFTIDEATEAKLNKMIDDRISAYFKSITG